MSNQSPLFSLLGTNSFVPQDFCTALSGTSQAGAAEWGTYLSFALRINMQAPPASNGENVLQHAKWAFAQFITKQVREKTVRKALKLGTMFCEYKVCSSSYWPRTLKQAKFPQAWFTSIWWGISCLVVTPYTRSSCGSKSRRTTSIYWGMHLSQVRRVLWGIYFVSNLQHCHARVHAAFHPKWPVHRRQTKVLPFWWSALQYNVSSTDWKL